MNRYLLGGLLVSAAAILLVPLVSEANAPTEHHISVEARSFAFEPAVFHVNRGDTVNLELLAVDVTHSLYLDVYGLELVSEPGRTARLSFVADRTGKFKFRCNTACGTLHPFMVGELIVRPNASYWGGLAAALLAAVGSVAYLSRRAAGHAGTADIPRRSEQRIELTAAPWLKRALRWRGIQPAFMLVTLGGFILAVLTGLLGTPAGSRNFAIIFVWIIWWAVLKLVLVPLGGRLWCAVCPIPAPGEWLQRGAIFVKRAGQGTAGLGLKWPHKLNNAWLQNGALLIVVAFSPIILTVPLVTGLVLLAFILLAVALSLVFERRAFCRFLCPVGGFIGLYSTVAPLELRVKDRQTCHNHREKECYLGSCEGHGCPWLVKPWTLERNTHCGLCTECLKTCPKDNVGVYLRPFGSDLFVGTKHRLDEAYTGFIMLASALLYSAVFLGPWGWLKDWAGDGSISGRAGYVAAFFAIALVLLPGFFLAAVYLGKALSGVRAVSTKRLFVSQSYALIPLGLSMWVAFSLAFLLVNGSFALPLLSDPFGWGWDLFGTASHPWTPVGVEVMPHLQIVTLLAGLILSTFAAHRLGRQLGVPARRVPAATAPITAFTVVLVFIWFRLYLG